MNIAEDTTTPENAVITWDQMKGNGTLNLYKGKTTATSGSSLYDEQYLVGSVSVSKNATSATIEDVFSDDDFGKYYAVEFVPDDTDTWASYKASTHGGTGFNQDFVLTELVKSYKITPAYYTNTTTAAVTAATIQGINQFKQTTDSVGTLAKTNAISGTMISTSAVAASSGHIAVTLGSNGSVQVTQKDLATAGLYVGTTYQTYELPSGQKLVVTIKNTNSELSNILDFEIKDAD